jgi:hypothetical protein
MEKAHLFEALYLVNRGIDEAARGMARLKRAHEIEIDPLAQALANFEEYRCRVNLQFLSDVRPSEERDLKRFEEETDFFGYNPLDDPDAAYGLVRIFEERRKEEGKPPLVQFLTPPEQPPGSNSDRQENESGRKDSEP